MTAITDQQRQIKAATVQSNSDLQNFAIAISREVNIRTGVFKPWTEQERGWARRGVCRPFELETVQAEMVAE